MTWKGKNPCVTLTDKVYETGIKVGKDIMAAYGKVIERKQRDRKMVRYDKSGKV